MREGNWVPADAAEYLRCAPTTPTPNLITMITLTASTLFSAVTNSAIYNLYDNDVDADLLILLGNNLNFVPTYEPSIPAARREIMDAYYNLENNMLNKDFFHFNNYEVPGQTWLNHHLGLSQNEQASWGHIPNPLWKAVAQEGLSESSPNKPQQFIPSTGLARFLSAAKAEVLRRLPTGRPPDRPGNLHPDQLHVLATFQRQSLMKIVTADKNLGCILDHQSRYDRLLLQEALTTHVTAAEWAANNGIDAFSVPDIIKYTLDRMRNELLPLVEADSSLPFWFLKFIRSAIVWNAGKKLHFTVPMMYLVYKMHKLSAAEIAMLVNDVLLDVPTRPISANYCWATQPIAVALAKILMPYVRRTAEFIKDSTEVIRRLSSRPFRETTLLLALRWPPRPER